MTTGDFLKRLCEGYIRSFRTLNLHSGTATWPDHTQRELAFFARIGEALGYTARLDKDRMDLSWWDPDSGSLELYLERERLSDKAGRDTVSKLLDSDESHRARYLVGIFGWLTEPGLATVRRAIGDRRDDRPFVLIGWVGRDENSIVRIQSFVYSESTVFTRAASAETDADGYWFARFSDEWRVDDGISGC